MSPRQHDNRPGLFGARGGRFAGRLLGLAMALWVLFVMVSTASANPFLLGGSTLCVEPHEGWRVAPAEPELELEPVVTSRCDGDGLDDPAFNVCFEGAEVPISTLPQLLAEAHAEQVALRIADVVDLVVPHGDSAPEVGDGADEERLTSRDERVEPAFALRIPRPKPRELACSSYPEECNALPPLPHLELAGGSTPAANTRAASYTIPPHTLQAPEPSHWAHPGLAPANEHRAPPKPPPRG